MVGFGANFFRSSQSIRPGGLTRNVSTTTLRRESHVAAEDATRDISFEHEGRKPVLVFRSVVTLCQPKYGVRSGGTL